MALRTWTRTFAGGVLATAMRDLNARHPWSHNDHFHGWILTGLPARRRVALDVGCGEGGLLAALAPFFAEVRGTDTDPGMRHAAARRCAGLPQVVVGDTPLAGLVAELEGEVDLVTMVAVLHHLDAPVALEQVRRLLAPGGRFLAVCLAPPRSLRDHAWDVASIVTNPLIGYVKHPWPSRAGVVPPAYPVAEPALSYDELRAVVDRVMPGAELRHRLGFRHTIAWTSPSPVGPPRVARSQARDNRAARSRVRRTTSR